MAKGQKRYTEEFKETLVELVKSGKTLGELSSEYGIPKSTINGWVKNSKPVVIDNDETISLKEFKALKKEMAKIKEENEILKKAMAIFAKE